MDATGAWSTAVSQRSRSERSCIGRKFEIQSHSLHGIEVALGSACESATGRKSKTISHEDHGDGSEHQKASSSISPEQAPCPESAEGQAIELDQTLCTGPYESSLGMLRKTTRLACWAPNLW